MSFFGTYFELGLHHIADIRGYDHILFIIALCATYTIKQVKELLILVTAFTIGHSLTLALAALNLITVNAFIIELLIPITIVVTSIYNVSRSPDQSFTRFKYLMALAFGLIHGMGFSNYFRTILGRESDIVGPLLAFNLGLEVGQLLIVIGFLLLETAFFYLLRPRKASWTLFVSGATAGISLVIIVEMLVA